ncbi:MAG: response regulator [Caulobacter sp.]|nr:response regulator [Caulobacter sp.]
MSSKLVVHIIDDDAPLRDSLAFLLEMQDFAPRLYESADAFMAALTPAIEGCIITDVRMPGMTGVDLARSLKARGVSLPVIVMTGHGDVPLAVEAMKAGVADFIEKPFSDDTILGAIRGALKSVQPDSAATARAEALERLAGLSPREQDVLHGVIAGKANKVIAHELEISPRTVEIYRANLMTKTGARNMPELMRLALAAGL